MAPTPSNTVCAGAGRKLPASLPTSTPQLCGQGAIWGVVLSQYTHGQLILNNSGWTAQFHLAIFFPNSKYYNSISSEVGWIPRCGTTIVEGRLQVMHAFLVEQEGQCPWLPYCSKVNLYTHFHDLIFEEAWACMQHNANECKESNDGEHTRPGSFSRCKVNGLLTMRNENPCQRLNTQSSRDSVLGRGRRGAGLPQLQQALGESTSGGPAERRKKGRKPWYLMETRGPHCGIFWERRHTMASSFWWGYRISGSICRSRKGTGMVWLKAPPWEEALKGWEERTGRISEQESICLELKAKVERPFSCTWWEAAISPPSSLYCMVSEQACVLFSEELLLIVTSILYSPGNLLRQTLHLPHREEDLLLTATQQRKQWSARRSQTPSQCERKGLTTWLAPVLPPWIPTLVKDFRMRTFLFNFLSILPHHTCECPFPWVNFQRLASQLKEALCGLGVLLWGYRWVEGKMERVAWYSSVPSTCFFPTTRLKGSSSWTKRKKLGCMELKSQML